MKRYHQYRPNDPASSANLIIKRFSLFGIASKYEINILSYFICIIYYMLGQFYFFLELCAFGLSDLSGFWHRMTVALISCLKCFFFNICQISWKLLTVRFYINCSCFQNATEQAKHILLGWLGNKTCFKEIKHKKAHLKWKLLTPPKWQKNVLNIFRHPRLIEQI